MSGTAVDFIVGLCAFAGPVYILIGLGKLVGSWFEQLPLVDMLRTADVLQLDLCCVFVLCCSLLRNGAPYTLVRAAVIAFISSLFELARLFGPVTFASELGVPPLPFRVPLLWIMMFTNCHSIARLVGANRPAPIASITALLMTFADMTTDPLYADPKLLTGGVLMKLWDWLPVERMIHGVPVSNFLCWYAVSFLSSMVFDVIAMLTSIAPRRPLVRDPRLPDAALCAASLFNGLFFILLAHVPRDIRITSAIAIALPAAIGLFRVFYSLEPKQSTTTSTTTSTTKAKATTSTTSSSSSSSKPKTQ
jgi:uncharacterized membrane protein